MCPVFLALKNHVNFFLWPRVSRQYVLPTAKPERNARRALQAGIGKAWPGVLFLMGVGWGEMRGDWSNSDMTMGLWWFNPLPIMAGDMDYLQLLYWHAPTWDRSYI